MYEMSVHEKEKLWQDVNEAYKTARIAFDYLQKMQMRLAKQSWVWHATHREGVSPEKCQQQEEHRYVELVESCRRARAEWMMTLERYRRATWRMKQEQPSQAHASAPPRN